VTLLDALSRLLPAQFEEVVFRVGVPAHYLSSSAAPQSERAVQLLRYVEQQGRTNDLRTAIEKVSAIRLTTTPTTTPETTMPTPDLSTRTIHADHRTGVVHLIREALALKGDDATEGARRILARCFAEDMTYAELPNLGERAVTRAIDRVLPDANIHETRVDELVAAVRAITPDRRVCPKCGRLDLQRVAGRWSPVSSDYCPADGGVYARVAFPADVIAWTTGRAYPPGTTHDDDRLPITDDAIRAWAMTSGGTLHVWTEAATRDEGVSLCDLARDLLRTGQTPNALATLDALADPRRAHLAVDADAMRVLVRRVRNAATSRAPTPPPGTVRAEMVGTWDKDRRKALREVLAELYPTAAKVAEVASDAGVRLGNVDLAGAVISAWFNVIEEAGKHGLLDALYRRARQEYPRNRALIALG